MPKKILITGAHGFIGSHFVEHILKNTDWDIVTLDRLDVSGTCNRIASIDRWDEFKPRVKDVWHDLKAPLNDLTINFIGQVDYIAHLAASSHVDRSITYPMEFVMDNVVGTANILDYARKVEGLQKFVYFSTDEVFGPAPEGVDYKEWDRYKASNPYSATKAGGEELCIAYENTYKLPIVITHCMNAVGERQHPEKFLPKIMKKILRGEEVLIHTDKTKTKPGSRFYIHARDISDAVLFLINNQTTNGDKYNIRGQKEINNLDFAQMVADMMGMQLKYKLVDFHSSRPGHDLRYSLDGSKLHEMGWDFKKPFEDRLKKTVDWTMNHKEWLFLNVPGEE
ncbi:NAD-dependent epimerase/dehydratase family protein [candidate division WWE3 bacterium]|uniref:NAD-dependent epimerase/dehydratase family protein n=1 Tax=candidate division WWE3 bacterium TaxID=2053526 RepID=A0A7X9E729_UNCKA|nr:NAD-dependent epimerase/dehydratase family protein [candidate division WWE3 bacterium]